MKTIVNIVAAVAVLGVAAPAVAGPATRTTTVAYQDLDLAKAAGAKALENRVEAAARRVCGAPESFEGQEIAKVANCRRDAFEGARPAMEVALSKARRGSVEILVAASR